MRETISKFTAPLFALLPDFSAAPARREATFGITVSIIFHLLLLLAVIILGGLLPERLLVNFAQSKPSLQEIELTVIPPAPKPEQTRTLTIEQLEQERQRDFLDSRGLAKAKDAPENPTFESDENMKAASELAARGTAPLPSQDGRTDRNSPDFANAKDALGKSVPAPAPDVPLPAPQPAKSALPDTAPPATPGKPPEPVKPTPPPQPESAPPSAEQIALSPPAVPTPTPAPEPPTPPEPPLPKPMMRTTAQVALLNPAPSTPVSKASGYQPMQEKTRVDGVISNRGKAAVDAVRTPLARYQKQVNDAIGSRWYYYIHDKMDLIAPGSMQITFAINADGKVTGITTGANTSNSSFADVCERAVREAEIGPPPPEVATELHRGQLDRTITFTFYPN